MKEVGDGLFDDELVDRFGAMASGVCAVHCAVCALLPAAFGALGLGFLVGHEAEWFFTTMAVVFAAGAAFLSWRRHRSALVPALLVLGIVGLLASRGIEMAAGHHDHHGEEHHIAAEHSQEHSDHHDSRAESEENHEGGLGDHTSSGDTVHHAGTAVGVFGGLILIFGHILNLNALARCREECCE